MPSRVLLVGLTTLVVAGAVAGEADQVYADPKGRFVVQLPAGWSIEHQDPTLGYVQISHTTGGGLALSFEQSQPDKWTVQSLMSMLETAMRHEYPVGELRKSLDLAAGENPGRLMFFKSPKWGGELVVGCVLLGTGGVTLQGIVSSPAPEEALIDLLKNVRERSEGK